MKAVAGVELIHPEAAEFPDALKTILGTTPDEVLKPALPYSTIARNRDSRTIALLGIRFDMTAPKARSYSVVHYADTLRYPEKADLRPGALRFVCAEPRYTDLVLRGQREVDRRGAMNLANLRTMLRVRASIDCVAFADGQFDGPDSLGAFTRFAREREAETALLAEIGEPDCAIDTLLAQAMEIPERRALARLLHEGFANGGWEELDARARNYRVRIPLRR